VASVFAETEQGKTVEHRNVALLMDAPDEQGGVRAMRGVIETLLAELHGPAARLVVEPAPPTFPALREGACARLTLVRADERLSLGYLGLLTPSTLAQHDLTTPVVVAEVGLEPLIAHYPPAARVDALPAFPSIARDLSL